MAAIFCLDAVYKYNVDELIIQNRQLIDCNSQNISYVSCTFGLSKREVEASSVFLCWMVDCVLWDGVTCFKMK